MSSEPSFVFQAEPRPSLAVVGTDERFPVRRVYCVGRNYADHAREMGHDPDREPPFFFMKPADTLLPSGQDFPYPSQSQDVHHEIELVAALKSGGRDIPADRALDCVFGYAVALDMTRRDLQAEAKKLGRPWDTAKAFDHSAPCGPLVPASKTGHPTEGAIWLEVNGDRRQSADLSDLIWSIPEMIAYLSGLFELKAGDVILTGTPAGVAAVSRGDRLSGGVDGIGSVETTVV